MRTTYNASVEGTYISLPFGDGQTASGTDLDAYHFATLDTDAQSGTDHAQFRQHSSAQGRWMSPDPYNGSYEFSNPQSLNRYAYVGNNPLSLIDSLGLCPQLYAVYSPTTVYINGVYQGTTWTLEGTTTIDNGAPCVPPVAGCSYIMNAEQNQFLGQYCTGGTVPAQPAGNTSGGNAPNKVGCGTVLPNGKTLGQYINQGRAQMQASIDSGSAAAGGLLTTFASICYALRPNRLQERCGRKQCSGNQLRLGRKLRILCDWFGLSVPYHA